MNSIESYKEALNVHKMFEEEIHNQNTPNKPIVYLIQNSKFEWNFDINHEIRYDIGGFVNFVSKIVKKKYRYLVGNKIDKNPKGEDAARVIKAASEYATDKMLRFWQVSATEATRVLLVHYSHCI